MDTIVTINAKFIEEHTVFNEVILELKEAFISNEIIAPQRHHHDFPNPEANTDSTLLIMPAWNPSKSAGVKIVTVSPENGRLDLPSINGTYLYLDAANGTLKALLEAKNLTTKRTAATSALASSFLSNKNASSLLMIGTGALSIDLIKAHASVRPLEKIYVWGRDFVKATHICEQLKNETFSCTPIKSIQEKISSVAIISCATLSKTPLILGHLLKPGQHIDLVGAYKNDMREADDQTIIKASVFLDTFQGGVKGSGDIVIPIQNGILKEKDIKADLFELCSTKKKGRTSVDEITVFKSVGHALEDLTAANYYYKKYTENV